MIFISLHICSMPETICDSTQNTPFCSKLVQNTPSPPPSPENENLADLAALKKVGTEYPCMWRLNLYHRGYHLVHNVREQYIFPQVCGSWIRMNRTTVITLMPRSEINVKVNVDLPKEETQDELPPQQQQLEQEERQQQQQAMENIFAIS